MHLVLVDGSGFIFRAFHALPQLTRKSDKLPISVRAFKHSESDPPLTGNK